MEVVRSFTELFLFGEARGDERMFEFFGHQGLLPLFCHLVCMWTARVGGAWMCWRGLKGCAPQADHSPYLLSYSPTLLYHRSSLPPKPSHTTKARDPHRPAVQAAVLQAVTLLLYNTRREEALHYLLSQNWLNDLLATFDEGTLLAVEEVCVENYKRSSSEWV